MKAKNLGTAGFIFPFSGSFNVDVWETVDGRKICVSEWDGEVWLECWEISQDGSNIGPSFEAIPIYRFEADGVDLSTLEENSDEWNYNLEIIGIDF